MTGRAGADYPNTGDDEAPETFEQLIPSAGGRRGKLDGFAMIRSRILASARVMRHRRIPVIQRFRPA